jgi:hypothetical protein
MSYPFKFEITYHPDCRVTAGDLTIGDKTFRYTTVWDGKSTFNPLTAMDNIMKELHEKWGLIRKDDFNE